MPIYEYQCPHCGKVVEKMQKLSDPPLTVCPECEKEGMEKLISMTSFHLKGGGWYADGYAKKKSEGAKESSSTKPDKGTSSEKKTDSTTSKDSSGTTKAPKPSSKD